MSEIKDQETEIKSCENCAAEAENKAAEATNCECCAAEAENKETAEKTEGKKPLSVVAKVRMTVIMVLFLAVACSLFFRNQIVEYLKRGQLSKQITEMCQKEHKAAPFSIEALGNYEFKVTFKDPATLKKYVKNNVVTFKYDTESNELGWKTDDDEANWRSWAVLRTPKQEAK